MTQLIETAPRIGSTGPLAQGDSRVLGQGSGAPQAPDPHRE